MGAPDVAESRENALARYKRAHRLTYDDLAARWGLKADYLRKIGCGHRNPSPRLAAQIEALSGGEIRKEELVFP